MANGKNFYLAVEGSSKYIHVLLLQINIKTIFSNFLLNNKKPNSFLFGNF